MFLLMMKKSLTHILLLCSCGKQKICTETHLLSLHDSPSYHSSVSMAKWYTRIAQAL